MTPKLVKTEAGQYEPAPFDGKNTSGIKPLSDNVLVRTDKAATTIGVLAKIHITDSNQEKQTAAATTGTIYALGDDAFRWNSTKTKPFSGERPDAGSRILFEQYAGVMHQGLDGAMYRLMSESCIGGIMIENDKGKSE